MTPTIQALEALGPSDDANCFIGKKLLFRAEGGDDIRATVQKIKEQPDGIEVHATDAAEKNVVFFFDRLSKGQGTPDYSHWFLIDRTVHSEHRRGTMSIA